MKAGLAISWLNILKSKRRLRKRRREKWRHQLYGWRLAEAYVCQSVMSVAVEMQSINGFMQ
jgi:hypothetical protein